MTKLLWHLIFYISKSHQGLCNSWQSFYLVTAMMKVNVCVSKFDSQ